MAWVARGAIGRDELDRLKDAYPGRVAEAADQPDADAVMVHISCSDEAGARETAESAAASGIGSNWEAADA